MRFAYTTIVHAPRFGWQPDPPSVERARLYEAVRTLGFDGIEWSPRWCDLYQVADAHLKRLAGEVRDSGLEIAAINLNRFILTRCEEAAEHRARLNHSVVAAEAMGASRVIISLSMPQQPTSSRPVVSGRSFSEDEFCETADFLKRVAKAAGDCGVELILELHDDGLLDTPALCLRMLNLIDQPNVSLNPDLGNLIRQTNPPLGWVETLQQLAPHAGYWHVKNYQCGVATPIWDGDINYGVAIEMMQTAGFDGWVSIESYFGNDRMQLQAESLRWLQDAVSKIATSRITT